MTYSAKTAMACRVLAAELRMFWQLSSAVSAIMRNETDELTDGDLDEIRDEVDLLADMTDCATLQRRARRLIVRIDCWRLGAVA